MNTGLIKTVLGQSDVATLQASALILFLLLFAAIILWVLWPGSKPYYESIAANLVKGEGERDGR